MSGLRSTVRAAGLSASARRPGLRAPAVGEALDDRKPIAAECSAVLGGDHVRTLRARWLLHRDPDGVLVQIDREPNRGRGRQSGMQNDVAPERTGNLLLDALTSSERAALLNDASHRFNPVGEERRNAGDEITSVFFPTSGTLSLIVEQDDERVEAATVGREGVCDVPASLGSRIASLTVLSQIEGDSIDVDVETFNKVYDEGPTFRTIITGYIEAVYSQASMSTACGLLHHLNERCARWLLQSHDRVDSDTFVLKQEFLAMMLGVHRPSVSIAAGTLQASGCITYRRGRITVIDREALEQAACSCYETIRSEYSRLVPLA